MRRTLAIALTAGVLLLGGCAKQQDDPPDAGRPASGPAATTSATPAAAPEPADSATADSAATSDDGVDSLLDEVDQQISSDDQPAADQD
ncbi:hypothetical protein ACWKSP_28375 [Micromonosporaceae bacterium Da 78-11]